MALVLSGLTWDTVLAFLDDAVVNETSIPSHFIINLRRVLERLRKYKLKLKPRKCELFQKKVEFLGRVVSKDGLEVNPGSLECVHNWPVPTCTKEVERFLGFANYHRGFIKNYAELACSLYDLTGKKPFIWEEKQEQSFKTLKAALTSTRVFALHNKKDHFILDTDASDWAIGAERIQVQDGQERVINYGILVTHRNREGTAPCARSCLQ
ncbi:uncharacterized protein [Haliotis cracherodii]|uniref:uncharacterized protein n=1 Tax=Haliotis cracherodii TaxID=6455 RepID=UPI0039E9A6AF